MDVDVVDDDVVDISDVMCAVELNEEVTKLRACERAVRVDGLTPEGSGTWWIDINVHL